LEGCKLINIIIEFVKAEAALVTTNRRAFEALEYLKQNVGIRNALFSMPPDYSSPPTLDEVVQFYLGVLSPFPTEVNMEQKSIVVVAKEKITKKGKRIYQLH
jgi:hypothetical protein